MDKACAALSSQLGCRGCRTGTHLGAAVHHRAFVPLPPERQQTVLWCEVLVRAGCNPLRPKHTAPVYLRCNRGGVLHRSKPPNCGTTYLAQSCTLTMGLLCEGLVPAQVFLVSHEP